jgi:hypothetical protein
MPARDRSRQSLSHCRPLIAIQSTDYECHQKTECHHHAGKKNVRIDVYPKIEHESNQWRRDEYSEKDHEAHYDGRGVTRAVRSDSDGAWAGVGCGQEGLSAREYPEPAIKHAIKHARTKCSIENPLLSPCRSSLQSS